MEKNSKDKILLKIKKAQGQLNKVQKMVENDEYCINVVNQNMAVIGLLKSSQQELLKHHLHNCFVEGVNNPKKQDEMIEELITIFNYYNK